MAEVISLADRRKIKTDAAAKQAEAERLHTEQQAAVRSAATAGNIYRSGTDDQKRVYALHQRHRRQLGDMVLGETMIFETPPAVVDGCVKFIISDGKIRREITMIAKDVPTPGEQQ